MRTIWNEINWLDGNLGMEIRNKEWSRVGVWTGFRDPVTGRPIIGICRGIRKVGIGIAIVRRRRTVIPSIGLDLDDWWFDAFKNSRVQHEHQNFQNPKTEWNLNWKNPASTFFEISSISWSIPQKTRFLMENFS